MRDAEFYRIVTAHGRQMAVLNRRLMFLHRRIEAFETILFDKGALRKALKDPSWFKNTVDAITLELIKQQDRIEREEAHKPKLAVVNGVA